MADVTRARTGELLRKLFEILKAEPEGLPAAEALERLAGSVTLSEYEAGVYDSGSRRLEQIVRFATVDCVKAGWLIKHKGTWAVTDQGIKAYNEITQPEAFYKEAVRLYHVWKKRQVATPNVTAEASEALPDEPEKAPSITFELAEERAWAEIESFVTAMDPYEVQDMVADLLKAMGYYPTWTSPPGKDGGLDIIAHPDPLGTRPPRIKVQVKRQQQRISREGLSAFLALVNEEDAGVFFCTGGFTKDAEDFARSQERRKIRLLDLEHFVELWIEHYSKLDNQARERLPLTPIYFLTPNQ